MDKEFMADSFPAPFPVFRIIPIGIVTHKILGKASNLRYFRLERQFDPSLNVLIPHDQFTLCYSTASDGFI
ncbi:UNVERIFIED_CONTAM: hypothetical protein FKN15_046028 [Acipenser sinensis]